MPKNLGKVAGSEQCKGNNNKQIQNTKRTIKIDLEHSYHQMGRKDKNKHICDNQDCYLSTGKQNEHPNHGKKTN